MADRFDAGKEPEATFAAGVLAAAALLASGDEDAAERRVRSVMTALPGDRTLGDVLDAARLLRALVRDRRGEVEEARSDYEALAAIRPDDPGPALRLRQLRLRIALAHSEIAKGYAEDAPRIERAQAEVDAVCDDVSAFADAHPGDSGFGLLAAQSDMSRGRWIEALKRLNALTERFPDNPSVLRGISAIFVNQFLVSRDTSLAEEALRSLNRAIVLDPRDARAALDAAGVRRIVGDIPGAIRLATRARDLESVPGGPAARTLAVLYLSEGRKALDQGNLDVTRKSIEAARRADPGPRPRGSSKGRSSSSARRTSTRPSRRGRRGRSSSPSPARRTPSSLAAATSGLKASLAWAGLREPPAPEATRRSGLIWTKAARSAPPEARERRWSSRASRRRASSAGAGRVRGLPAARPRRRARGRRGGAPEGVPASDPEAQRERAQLAVDAWVRGRASSTRGRRSRRSRRSARRCDSTRTTGGPTSTS